MRVTVMGLGTFGGGIGAARYCAENGACVTVTDMKSKDALGTSLDALAGYNIDFVLGEHRIADFTGANLVVVSPAVPRESRYVQAAREAGVPLTTEIGLFVAHCPARVCGITGSNGKTTTVSMLESILAAANLPHHTGGNIGGSLLSSLPAISAGETVVLELSSFQLEWLDEAGWSPAIAAVLNIMPNHLDRHGTIDAYRDAKAAILDNQAPGDTAILVSDDGGSLSLADRVRGRTVLVGHDIGDDGVAVNGAWLTGRRNGVDERLFDTRDLNVPGAHNVLNAAVAAACARELGIGTEAIACGLAEFRGVPHRLEFVGEHNGIRFFNDSKSTTPDATAAAVNAFGCAVIPILGGYDKGVSFEKMAGAIAGPVWWAALIGTTAPALETALGKAGVRTGRFDTLEDAFAACLEYANPADIVLLSPGCASYDMFSNYEERGEVFRALVHRLIDGGGWL